MAIDKEKEKYFVELTHFVKQTLKVWGDKKYTGSMIINWSDGVVTGFKPSLVYGVSTSPDMIDLFSDHGS